MTRVDFYVLESAGPQGRHLLACRLAEKAYQQGHHVYIHVADASQAAELDELLWTFREASFIPHTCIDVSEDFDTRVHIGTDDDPLHHDDVLINLAPSVPLFFSRFRRVAEVVDAGDEQRRLGRERFRFYRDRGYPLESHTLKAG